MEGSAATVPARSIRSLLEMLATPDALRWHAALFAAGATTLTLVNVMRSPDRLWFWAPLLVWSALLTAHGLVVLRGATMPIPARAPAPAPTHRPAATVLPSPVPDVVAEPAAPVAPTPAALASAALAPIRMPAVAELAALRLSLDPWATGALGSASASPDELPESVLALWRLAPADPPVEPLTTAPVPPAAVDLQALGWI